MATEPSVAPLPEGSPVQSAVAFSPDGRTLAAGDDTGHVDLWNVAKQQADRSLTEGSPVNSVAFSPDGRTLAVGQANGNISFSDTDRPPDRHRQRGQPGQRRGVQS